MNDTKIIDLYENRDESAISMTAGQYSPYLTAIAMNILRNKEDAEECVNDVYLKAWNIIPPERPQKLSSFLGRIARNLSLNRYESMRAKKRGGSEMTLLLSELELCIPDGTNVEEEVEGKDLKESVNRFLETLNQDDMVYFMRRYWHAQTVPEIARRHDVSESKVKMSLHRTRGKLKTYLEKIGVTV